MCQNGYPMMRSLFFECPKDPGAWLIDDAYFFSDRLLVPPLFDEKEEREIYLPAEAIRITLPDRNIRFPGGIICRRRSFLQ